MKLIVKNVDLVEQDYKQELEWLLEHEYALPAYFYTRSEHVKYKTRMYELMRLIKEEEEYNYEYARFENCCE